MSLKLENPYQAFQLYIAIKNHFLTSYDYFKYNGKVKTQYTSFEVRKDKYFFAKLQKHADPLGLLVSQFVDSPGTWIGDIVNLDTSEHIYRKWKQRQDSITYTYKENLKKLPTEIDQCLDVPEYEHPLLLKLLLGNSIYPETVILLNLQYNFFPYWKLAIEDNIVWPGVNKKLEKYQPFLQFDKNNIKKITVDYFQ